MTLVDCTSGGAGAGIIFCSVTVADSSDVQAAMVNGPKTEITKAKVTERARVRQTCRRSIRGTVNVAVTSLHPTCDIREPNVSGHRGNFTENRIH